MTRVKSTIRAREQGRRLAPILKAAGLNTVRVADVFDISPTTVARLLTGQRTWTDGAIGALLGLCGPHCTPQQRAEILALCPEHTGPHGFRCPGPDRLTAYAAHLRATECAVAFHTNILPWPLHTPDYHHAVLPAPTTNDSPQWSTAHRELTRLIDATRRPTLTFFLHEWLLHTPVGGPDIMAAHLRHLLAAAERVSLRLVPIAAGPYPGGHDSFTILHFRRERPAVYRDDGDAGVFTDDDHTVHHYHATAHTLDTIALDHRATRQAITDAIESHRDDLVGNIWDRIVHVPPRQPAFVHS